MALLSDAERVIAWTQWMRENRDTVALSKVDLRAAIDAADGWVDSNSAAFNTALPVAARNGLTTKQKAFLLMVVVARRYGIL